MMFFEDESSSSSFLNASRRVASNNAMLAVSSSIVSPAPAPRRQLFRLLCDGALQASLVVVTAAPTIPVPLMQRSRTPLLRRPSCCFLNNPQVNVGSTLAIKEVRL